MNIYTKQFRTSLNIFLIIVYSHLFEHIAQMFQLYILGWPRPKCLGILGLAWPYLVHSEYLHYGHALFMLIGIYFLTKYMYNKDSLWCMQLTFILAFYHHFEHLILLIQLWTKTYLYNATVPMSLGQAFLPRIELHFLYNLLVGIPMMIALNLNESKLKKDIQ